jgi:CzcA family heavy metal efflux pump
MLGMIRMALRRPYTVAVMALLMLLLGALSAKRMIVDIFPVIDIPVVLVAWNYPGLSAEDMERRVVVHAERGYSTSVNGIERIESHSIPGVGLLKLYFYPGTDIGAAIAQISAMNQTLEHNLPPGMSPPMVVQFNASNVPVVQMDVGSDNLSEQQIYDYALNFIRIQLFTIPGLSTPAPFGGKQRQIMVDIDPERLAARGVSPQDVVNALLTADIIIPGGTARIGSRDYTVLMNSSPSTVERFADIPVKTVGNQQVLVKDVAKVHDSYAVQQSIVHINGKRATYLTILKHAESSTLAVVDATRDMLPQILATAPKGLTVGLDFDQSVFVRGAVQNVLQEVVIAAVLVALMILLFLGSWRSTLVVVASIPLAIFTALIGLYLTGNSINLMTLGGLALAVGILVDNATVVIENIHRHLVLGKAITVAIIDGAREVVQPVTVATLAICIVFFPVVLLEGAARFLFTPLGLTVVLAMAASYLLSFTLVPVLCRMLLPGELHALAAGHGEGRIDRAFGRLRESYGRLLTHLVDNRGFVLATAGVLIVLSLGLTRVIGTDFFPSADVGIMKLHVRAPAGTRIEDTEKQVLRIEDEIRKLIPAGQLHSIDDLIGVPLYYNLAFVQTDNISGMDAEISISLNPKHRPTADYMRLLREKLPDAFPGSSFYFQTADIVSQVLNFGLSAPIDVQVSGMDLKSNAAIARHIQDEIARIPGVIDAHIPEMLDYPALRVNVNRQLAARLGLSQRDVANSVLTSLSSSSMVSPVFYLAPNGVNYTVAVQTPMSGMDSLQRLMSIPLSAGNAGMRQIPISAMPAALPGAPVQRLSNVASVVPEAGIQSIDHYTVQRVMDVQANVQGRDLGGVANDIQRVIEQVQQAGLPAGTKVVLRGQSQVMNSSFSSLALGIILAVILVYCLMVVLFQSWLDPLIIILAVPGALVGILWMLALTGTTINVESLMGAVMSVGIAVSNSILVVSFANDLRAERGLSAVEAAIEAGKVRLRPVLMTAIAMIIGMVPMALALGEGGEQNAPLGRAVIGGLVVATLTTLLIVPAAYAALRRKPPMLHILDERFEREARGEAVSGELS